MNGGDDETRTRDLCRDRAPIATLGALRNSREVLLHPSCTQIRGVNPLDGTNYLDTASAFLKAFLHLLAGEGSGEGDGI
jgi:hypothetical protein